MKKDQIKIRNPLKIGWREWISLPEFNISLVKAKIDTGARTSAIHALNIHPFETNGVKMVHFLVRPIQKNNIMGIDCVAKVIDQRNITDSGGRREKRYIISTIMHLGSELWPVELSLTNRSSMTFRLILGRTALKKRFTVDPSRSYLLSHRSS